MKQTVRELLVTTKVAQNWQQEDFEQKVDELLAIVGKVDNDKKVADAGEVLDVYHKTKQKLKKATKKTRQKEDDKPFEFIVFRN
jgi:uncharacterized protein CbrC (UPF0167 family)